MGSKHTRAKSNQPVLKAEAVICATQSSEGDSTTPPPSIDPRMYHIRRASQRNSLTTSLNPACKQCLSPSRLSSPAASEINVSKLIRNRQRPSLPGLVSPNLRISLSPNNCETLPVNPFSTQHSTTQTKTKHVFTSPTRILLTKQLRQNSPPARIIEFEDEGNTPAFVRTNKERPRRESQRSTYKLIKPRRDGNKIEVEAGTNSRDLMTLLRQAAAIKYETQQKGSTRNIMELLGVAKLTGNLTSSMSAIPGSRNMTTKAESGLKYKIKSMLNLNLVNAHAEKESEGVEKKPKIRVWKGRRGTILVPFV